MNEGEGATSSRPESQSRELITALFFAIIEQFLIELNDVDREEAKLEDQRFLRIPPLRLYRATPRQRHARAS